MDLNKFKKGIIMPEEQPMIEEMPKEEVEHPNSKILENSLVSQDSNSKMTHSLLENMMVNNSDKMEENNKLLEHNLVKSSEIKDAIKDLSEQIKKSDEIWDIKLILE